MKNVNTFLGLFLLRYVRTIVKIIEHNSLIYSEVSKTSSSSYKCKSRYYVAALGTFERHEKPDDLWTIIIQEFK